MYSRYVTYLLIKHTVSAPARVLVCTTALCVYNSYLPLEVGSCCSSDEGQYRTRIQPRISVKAKLKMYNMFRHKKLVYR